MKSHIFEHSRTSVNVHIYVNPHFFYTVTFYCENTFPQNVKIVYMCTVLGENPVDNTTKYISKQGVAEDKGQIPFHFATIFQDKHTTRHARMVRKGRRPLLASNSIPDCYLFLRSAPFCGLLWCRQSCRQKYFSHKVLLLKRPPWLLLLLELEG